MLIDSSTIVKFLSREPGWEDAQVYVSEGSTIPLALVELAQAFLKKSRRGETSLAYAREIVKDASGWTGLIAQDKYMAEAFEIASANNLPIYDSLFIAAALGEKQELVSSDKRQLSVAAKLGVKIIEC